MRLIGAMLVCVGCHAGGTMQPDSAIDSDVPVHGLGMSVTWNAEPALPGSVTDKITVSDASFQIDHLQLLSDAGADNRTTRSRYQLRWSSSMTPSNEMFPDAPVAVYQRISLDIRQGFPLPYAYQIQGTWRDDGEDPKPFKIVDMSPLSIPIDCSATLPAGGMVSIAIQVDLQDALNSIDFRSVSEQDGTLLVNGGPQLAIVHDRMTHAFKLDD